MTNLTDVILNNCKEKMYNLLDENGIDNSGLDLDEVLNGSHCQPFENLKTAYQQAQFVKYELSYVVHCISSSMSMR